MSCTHALQSEDTTFLGIGLRQCLRSKVAVLSAVHFNGARQPWNPPSVSHMAQAPLSWVTLQLKPSCQMRGGRLVYRSSLYDAIPYADLSDFFLVWAQTCVAKPSSAARPL